MKDTVIMIIKIGLKNKNNNNKKDHLSCVKVDQWARIEMKNVIVVNRKFLYNRNVTL